MLFHEVLDIASVFVWGLSGGLVAARARLDIVGFCFLAVLTAFGGGTVRDLLLGVHPVFWITQPWHILVACAAAMLVFVAAHRIEPRRPALNWIDAVAMAVALAAGVSASHVAGASWPIILIMGMITGTFGGMLRDIVANEVPMVLRDGDLYVTACLVGAVVVVMLMQLLPGAMPLAVLAGAVVTFLIRAGALVFGWRLPVYRPRGPG